MKKDEWRLLWPFYLMALGAASFSVTLPVWMIFFQHKFTFTQISFAVSVQALAAILLEIPAGAAADLFGRKFSVVAGVSLQGLLWSALPFINSWSLLYAAFFLMGGLRALESGADKAWIVDWLKCNGKGDLIHDMFIKIQSLSSAGLIISSLLASLLLFFFEIEILFFVQGCGYLIEGLFLFFFAKEESGKREKINNGLIHNTLRTSKEGVYLLCKNKSLLYLVLATAFAVCLKDFGCLAWQPLLVEMSLPAEYLGVAFSIISLTGIVTPFFSKKLLEKIGREKHYLAFTTFVEFITLLLLYFVNKPFFTLALIVYLSVTVLSDLQAPVGSRYFQALIPGSLRATMGSVQAMIFAAFSLVITVIGGHIMDMKGPKTAIMYFSFFLIPSAVFYLRIKNRAPDHP
ncbi:MAG: MFS transporter [Nitrospirae bacterium]|nr:MFS transporter [Nitrospirota bacterium]